MFDKRKRKYTENLERCYKIVQQSRTGVRAVEVAEKLDVHRTTAHSYLNTLELMGKVYSEHGLWYPKEAKTKEEIGLNVKDFAHGFFKETISEIKYNLENDFIPSAFRLTVLLYKSLPKQIEEKIKPELEKALEKLHDKNVNVWDAEARFVYDVCGMISKALYESSKEGF